MHFLGVVVLKAKPGVELVSLLLSIGCFVVHFQETRRPETSGPFLVKVPDSFVNSRLFRDELKNLHM